ncbi:hypothetical protein BG005_009137 [Podila minutissima]|nr:hypothetical protein BG005_009137 [Podila minutissima]
MVASTVESITLRNATTEAFSHPFRPQYRTPFVRLRHLVLKGSSSLRWLNGTNLPWMRAPNLETIRCSSPRAVSYMDIDNLALEIKAATEAAAAGTLFYGPGGAADNVEYVRGQFYDPWRGMPASWSVEDPDVFEQYRGMVPGKRIREFECVLPNHVAPRAMADVIRNMDMLERFVVHGVREAMQALAPLEMHVETLVELDVRDCGLTSERLVVFLEQCPRLQVFVADKVEAAVAAKSRPWACCVGIRRLQVEFYAEERSFLPGLDEMLEHLLERLAGFARLERFYMPEYWHRYGLDRLQGLTTVRDVQFTPTSLELLTVADAKWMVEHWPELAKVRVPVSTTDYKIPVEATIEIQELIAQHLDTDSLLACLRVCKAWSISFSPALWNIVVASSSGPDFFAPQNQPLLRHIRVLDYHIRPLETQLPALGFTRLTTLKIGLSKFRTFAQQLNGSNALWTTMTAILHTLSQGPLSTLELSHGAPTEAFWDALASCTSLHTLVLKNLTITRSVFLPLWRTCCKVETLALHYMIVHPNSHTALPRFRRTRLARLRHVVLECGLGTRSTEALWPLLCAPYLETVRCGTFGMALLVAETRDATMARREGRVFYRGGGMAQGELHLGANDDDDDEDPAETEQLRGLVPGEMIREFRFVYPFNNRVGSLPEVIATIRALERFEVREVKGANRILAPLVQHVETLVELDILGCDLTQEALVLFLERCPVLQVFVANKIDTEFAVKTPWVCTGLRVLRVEFYEAKTPLCAYLTAFGKRQEKLLKRLARMSYLKRFCMPEYWYRCGLERLQGLGNVQDVSFSLRTIVEMRRAHTIWMVEHWPRLKAVRVHSDDIGFYIPRDSAKVLKERGVQYRHRHARGPVPARGHCRTQGHYRAGRSVVHFEMPGKSQNRAHGLQLWINLPKKHKMCEPQYQELLDGEIKRATPQDGVLVKVIAGESPGVKSQVYTCTPTMYLDYKKAVEQAIQLRTRALSSCSRGTAYTGDEEFEGQAHHTLTFSEDRTSTIKIRTKDRDAPL